MRFFQYSATDAQGRPAAGTIRAASADSARDALTQAGFRVSQVLDPGPQTAAQQDRALRAAIAPQPLQPVRPSVQPAMRTPAGQTAPIAIAVPSTGNPQATKKTKFGKDKDLFFLFSQLSQYYKAGVTPTTALHDLANKAPERYRESLLAAEKASGEGRSLSGVLDRYPYLYSPDVIGALRAGELSGSLSEAAEQIADQKMTSHRLRMRLLYFLVIFLAVLIFFPICLAVVNGSLRAIGEQDQANGSLSPWGTLMHGIGIEVLHGLPWMLPFFLLVVGGYFLWNSMPLRNFRHRLVLGFPVLGGRVKAEAMARFTWALGMVSRGGTSPHQTFQIAAESVPNLIVRARLMHAAASMSESEKLSAALRRSATLPVEYTHIVETGETTGDVPRALSDINRATDADFRARDASASTLTGFIFYAGLAVLVLVLMVILYRMFYGGMITKLTEGD